MMSSATAPRLAVCPTAQASPSRHASPRRPCRVASVETAARWSGSKAWRRPSSRPRAAGASRAAAMSAPNLAYLPTFMPLGLSKPVPMELTCPGVATLRRDPDKATGGRAEDAEAADAALAASGDGSAFERLYRSHAARVHSLVRRMMGPETADDVTQDVFIRAWQKLSTFRGEAAFGTWLHRVAVNVILARRTSLGVERGRFDDREDALESASGR